MFPGSVSLFKVFPSGMVESADGLTQVAVVVGRTEVDLNVLVVGDDPWKNGILVLQTNKIRCKR